MTLDEIFNADLCIEAEMQKKYKDCVGLLDMFSQKTQDELKLEISDIWKTWEKGKGKAEFCIKTGLDVKHIQNLIFTPTIIPFADYARIMSVGKNYVVIENKYQMDEKETKLFRSMKNKEKYKTKKAKMEVQK